MSDMLTGIRTDVTYDIKCLMMADTAVRPFSIQARKGCRLCNSITHPRERLTHKRHMEGALVRPHQEVALRPKGEGGRDSGKLGAMSPRLWVRMCCDDCICFFKLTKASEDESHPGTLYLAHATLCFLTQVTVIRNLYSSQIGALQTKSAIKWSRGRKRKATTTVTLITTLTPPPPTLSQRDSYRGLHRV